MPERTARNKKRFGIQEVKGTIACSKVSSRIAHVALYIMSALLADLGQGEDLGDKGAEGEVAGEGSPRDDNDDVAAPLGRAAAVQLPHPAVLQPQPPQLPAHRLPVNYLASAIHGAPLNPT